MVERTPSRPRSQAQRDVHGLRRYLAPSEQLMDELGMQRIKPRASSRYDRETEAARQRWVANCPGVDEVLAPLAAKLNGEYPSGEAYPDARALTWSEGRIGYSVSMMLQQSRKETVLRVFSAAWIDDEAKLIRRSIDPYHVDLETPVRARVLEGTIDGLMAELVVNTPALVMPTRFPSVKVTETSLSPAPGNT